MQIETRLFVYTTDCTSAMYRGPECLTENQQVEHVQCWIGTLGQAWSMIATLHVCIHILRLNVCCQRKWECMYIHGRLTFDSAVASTDSATLCEGGVEGLERGAGRGGFFGAETAGMPCWGTCGSKMLLLLATDSECSIVGFSFGPFAAFTGARVLFEMAVDTAVVAGGNFPPVGAFALPWWCGWDREEGAVGGLAAGGAGCLGCRWLTGGAWASLAGGGRCGTSAGCAHWSIELALGSGRRGFAPLPAWIADALIDFSSLPGFLATVVSFGGMPSGPVAGGMVWK